MTSRPNHPSIVETAHVATAILAVAAGAARAGPCDQTLKLLADDATINANLGIDIAIEGTIAIIGAHGDAENGPNAGAAYLLDITTGEQLAKILPDDRDHSDRFGRAATTLVGAPYDDDASSAGSVYVFECGEDTDADGLLDSWETDGLDVNGDGEIDLDLPAMGADPMHKDLFVEVDVMDTVPLDTMAIAYVVDAFALAPVDNPDGVLGINLHIDLTTADTLPHEDTWDDDFVTFGAIKGVFLGTDDERLSDNWQHIRDARAKVFRYCTVIEAFEGGALGWGENPGNDFMVAFGGNASGDTHLQASTFMHELGHSLGLGHGGASIVGDELVPDPINYKPNYVSVMNYAFDHYTRVTGEKLDPDFSREPPVPLFEDNLDETIGITSSWYYDVLVFHGWREPGELPEIAWLQLDTPSCDWNHDGEQEAGVAVDLNWLGEGYPGAGAPSPGQTLNSYDDWDLIMLPMGEGGAFEDGQHIPPPYDELTEEGLIYLRENIPPAPTCPPDCNADGELDILDFVCFQGEFVGGCQ